MKKYKIGIIGFGGVANWHLRTFREEDYSRAEFVGIYDINPERGKLAKEKGLKVYSSAEEMLTDQEIDIVLVATSNDVHKELSIKALKAGKHVICEKPVTITSDDLLDVMEAAQKANKIFTINQNRRCNKDYIQMRNVVSSGALGKVYVIESRVEGSRGMAWGWRSMKKMGGGSLLDWGVHLIDQLLLILDGKVTDVYCTMNRLRYKEVEDNFRLVMHFDDGAEARIEVGTNNFIVRPRWYVLGENGTLQIDDWSGKGRMVQPTEDDEHWEEEIIYSKAGPTKTMIPRSKHTIKVTEYPELEDVKDSLSVSYDQLIDAIEDKAPLRIQPEEALRVLKVIEAAFASAETGECIKVCI